MSREHSTDLVFPNAVSFGPVAVSSVALRVVAPLVAVLVVVVLLLITGAGPPV